MINDENRKKWLKERTAGIGGSDASVILGINPWKSKLELWTEKVTGIVIEEDNPDLHWGKKLEPFILEEYIELTKRDVRAGCYDYENLVSKEYPFMRANLDGVIIDKERGDGILEMKTKSAYIRWNSDIPDYYNSQIQHYFAVTGYNWGSFAVLDFGKKSLFWCDVERNDEFIENLIKEEEIFWNSVVNKIPPEVDGSMSCERFLRDTYSQEKKLKEIDLRNNEKALEWAILLRDVKKQIEDLKESETLCQNNLMNLMGDAEIALGDCYKITWKSGKDKEVFDLKDFKKNHLDLYKKYATLEKQTRRFTVRFNKHD